MSHKEDYENKETGDILLKTFLKKPFQASHEQT